MHKAVDYLARREHSEHELKTKLLAKDFDVELIDEVLESLKSQNYLDDARYAKMILKNGYERGHGPQKVAYHLRQKQVDSDIVQQEFESFEADWFALAKQVKLKKFGDKPLPSDTTERFKEKAKQMRFLTGRGFDAAQIQGVVDDQ
jgi:regulatory protein